MVGRRRQRPPTADPPQRHVQLDGGEIGRPDQGWEVAEDGVVDVLAVVSGWNVDMADPIGRVGGEVLAIEGLAADAIRVTLHGERSIANMREQDRSDVHVVVDEFALGEPGIGIQDLVQIRQAERAPLDLDPLSSPQGSRTTPSADLSARRPRHTG